VNLRPFFATLQLQFSALHFFDIVNLFLA